MTYLDNHPDVLSWSSEELIVRYRCPVTGKIRRYFPDFKVTFKTRTDKVITKVIEIKPASQCVPPKRKSKYYVEHVKTYMVNQAKWEACSDFCKRRNMEFQVLTERDLGIKK